MSALEAEFRKRLTLAQRRKHPPRAGRFPVFHVCSTSEPSPTRDVSVLFLMFPVFLVVENMAITRPLRPYGSWPEIQNTGNAKNSLSQTGNKLGTRPGTPRTS